MVSYTMFIRYSLHHCLYILMIMNIILSIRNIYIKTLNNVYTYNIHHIDKNGIFN